MARGPRKFEASEALRIERVMIARLAWRLATEVHPRLLFRFLWNFVGQGARSIRRFRRQVSQGLPFPAFIFVSVTDACNLACRGCWTRPVGPPRRLPLGTVRTLIRSGLQKGVRVWGILGGEPLLYPELSEIFQSHPQAYFILFTNGTLFTENIAAELRRSGNVSPVVSIEGRERESDVRRGGRDVYRRSLHALEVCRRFGLVAGVATSVCRSNFLDVVTDEFVRDMARAGAHYLWYYVYRPVGPDPCPDLALQVDHIRALRRFLVNIRRGAPLLVVDAYWDQHGRPLCPAATGISVHIGPGGHLEPCPPIQFASDRVEEGGDLGPLIAKSRFLNRFRKEASALGGGCILLEAPERLAEVVRVSRAQGTGGRGTELDELGRMRPRCSHRMEGEAIPEPAGFYRWAKKHWFFGLAAYG